MSSATRAWMHDKPHRSQTGWRCLLQWGVRLAFALLMAVSLLFGQTKLCPSTYVRQDGAPCITCPVAPCVTVVAALQDIRSSITNDDCRSCCKLTNCETPHAAEATAVQFPSGEIHAVLPRTLAVSAAGTQSFAQPILPHVPAGFANAPPADRQGRAPPLHLS